jgi:hypothetical protein
VHNLATLVLARWAVWAAATGLERPRPKPSEAPVTYDRLDVWVLKVAIAIPAAFLIVVLLTSLIRFLSRKLSRPRVARRISPEPPARERRPEPSAEQADGPIS